MRQTNTDWNIEILGVNQIGASAANPLITAGRILPWVQDTTEAGVWEKWGVTYRDVRILDSQNQLSAVYNVTSNDLGVPANRAALKELFLKAAQAIDTDKDGLPDDWETRYLTNLVAAATDDSDNDGADNFTEFAFGAHPKNSRSIPGIPITRNRNSVQLPVTLSFLQRAGSMAEFTIETSEDLVTWSQATPVSLAVQLPVPLYDGSGMMEVVGFPTSSALLEEQRFFRVRAALRQRP